MRGKMKPYPTTRRAPGSMRMDGVEGQSCSCPPMPPNMSQTVLRRSGRGKLPKVGNSQDACAFLQPFMSGRPQEDFIVMPLANDNQVLGVYLAARGSRSETLIDPPSVFVPALLTNAARVIVAHNHPTGDPNPSSADMAVTRRLVDLGEKLGIPVLDQIVVGDHGCASVRDRGGF